MQYDFFPLGTQFCSQANFNSETNPNGCVTAKTVVLPCDFQDMSESSNSSFLSISAPTEQGECVGLVLDVSSAEFNAEGLLFNSPVSIFEKNFLFRLTHEGLVETTQNQVMTLPDKDVRLESVYDVILEMHQN